MIRKETLEKIKEYQELYKILDMKEVPITKDSFITTKKYQCILNNGKIIIREQIFKNGKPGSAVIIVALTKEENTILVVEPRVFTELGVGISFPAGYVDDGEKPEDAGLRELVEETGYVPENIIELTEFYQDQACSAAKNRCFLAINCVAKEEQHLDRDEYISYLECTLEEAIELYKMKYINDANGIIALTSAKKYLKR